MADTNTSTNPTKSIIGYALAALALVGLAFAVGYGLTKGKKVAS